MTKALVLFSGGLDSVITIKLLQEQNIEVIAFFLQNGFRIKNTDQYLIDITNKLNVKLVIQNAENIFFDMWKNPSFGYGKAINPCINCHALMANEAEKYRVKHNIDFIATGDVLDQRGFSQTSKQLKKVISIINNNDKILRPLSAKSMRKTQMEIDGLVDREKLLNIKGKSRKIQYDLLKKYGLTKSEVESPGGGCLMAEQSFKNNVKKYINELDFNDFQLMKYGRHLIINNFKLILSRNINEHKIFNNYNGINYIKLETNNLKSPIAFIKKSYFDKYNSIEILNILKKYSKFTNDIDKQNFNFNEKTLNNIK